MLVGCLMSLLGPKLGPSGRSGSTWNHRPLNSPRVTRYKSLLTAVPVTVGSHAARQPTAADCVCLRELLMDALFLQGDSEEDLEEPSQEQR